MSFQRSIKYYRMMFLKNLIEAGSSGIEDIMTDVLDLGGLQVQRYISKNYTSQVNQVLSRCFFSVFSDNLGRRGVSTIFPLPIIHDVICISSYPVL